MIFYPELHLLSCFLELLLFYIVYPKYTPPIPFFSDSTDYSSSSVFHTTPLFRVTPLIPSYSSSISSISELLLLSQTIPLIPDYSSSTLSISRIYSSYSKLFLERRIGFLFSNYTIPSYFSPSIFPTTLQIIPRMSKWSSYSKLLSYSGFPGFRITLLISIIPWFPLIPSYLSRSVFFGVTPLLYLVYPRYTPFILS